MFADLGGMEAVLGELMMEVVVPLTTSESSSELSPFDCATPTTSA
jgi:hypothetical protein